MNNQELLGLAAKAAGMVGYEYSCTDQGGHECMAFDEGGTKSHYWNPLADDGDALRLAVKLGLRVDMNYRPNPASGTGVGVWTPGDSEFYPPFWQIDGNDPVRAVRSTIVRAAAEMARSATD